MQIQKLGNDFTKSIKMNLLPGIKLSRGYWRSEIQFVTHDQHDNMAFNYGSWNHGGEHQDFDIIVGQDVREITFICHRHNSFPGYPNTYYKYTLRVDRLLLLNIVYKLIGSTIQPK